MSFSVEPHEVLGMADRVRGSFEELHEIAIALRRAADAVALALARATPAHAAFLAVAEARVDLARRIVGRGQAAVSALQTAALAYLTADDEMAATTDARAAMAGVGEGNLFDPTVFGRRRL